MVNGFLNVALPGCDDSEGDPGFCGSHGRTFGAVDVGAGADLVCEISSELVLGEHAVAVHVVEVELGRIDGEVVIDASLLVALDVHPRVAMQILRHTQINITMAVYSEVPPATTRNALKRLGRLLDA